MSPPSDNPLPNDPGSRKILVWDAPVRVFHWLMVLSFAGAYLSAESERWQLLHVTLGYTMAGLVVFRILWGLIGTQHARFSAFVHGPRTVVRYLGTLLRGRPEHYTGHNPAGALAIVALLMLTLRCGIWLGCLSRHCGRTHGRFARRRRQYHAGRGRNSRGGRVAFELAASRELDQRHDQRAQNRQTEGRREQRVAQHSGNHARRRIGILVVAVAKRSGRWRSC